MMYGYPSGGPLLNIEDFCVDLGCSYSDSTCCQSICLRIANLTETNQARRKAACRKGSTNWGRILSKAAADKAYIPIASALRIGLPPIITAFSRIPPNTAPRRLIPNISEELAKR